MKITDKMRLDWIEKNNALLDASCCHDTKNATVNVQGDDLGFGDAPTVRAAIDQAMKTQARWKSYE